MADDYWFEVELIVADSTNMENVFSVEKGRHGEGNVIITDVIYVKIMYL